MPDPSGRPYVYLAGPDVFFPDALERGARMKDVLAARELYGLFPLDGAPEPGHYADSKAFALAIGDACEAMMRQADIAIANIQPWRGPEADDGTSYEIGFMAALGKPIVLHTSDPRPFSRRLIDDVYGGEVYDDGGILRGMRDRMMIEVFDGFADNLMLINAAVKSAARIIGSAIDPADIVHHSFETAADFAKALWERSAKT
jgi:nucleoside 2-deoxyribosyltransferase